MSLSALGLQTPALLPVTAIFAPAFGFYYALLALRTSLVRVEANTFMGNNVEAKGEGDAKQAKAKAATESNSLLVASRCHGNFVENVPLALIVTSFVELNGGNPVFLTGALLLLLFFRVVHVEFGLRAKNSLGWGRPVGYFGTLAYVTGLSTYAAWLSKSHWGF